LPARHARVPARLRQVIFSTGMIFKIDQHDTLTLQQKKLYVIVSMDFHPFLANADTVFERFDKDPVFNERRRAEILQRD
jgi:hypothetical protein